MAHHKIVWFHAVDLCGISRNETQNHSIVPTKIICLFTQRINKSQKSDFHDWCQTVFSCCRKYTLTHKSRHTGPFYVRIQRTDIQKSRENAGLIGLYPMESIKRPLARPTATTQSQPNLLPTCKQVGRRASQPARQPAGSITALYYPTLNWLNKSVGKYFILLFILCKQRPICSVFAHLSTTTFPTYHIKYQWAIFYALFRSSTSYNSKVYLLVLMAFCIRFSLLCWFIADGTDARATSLLYYLKQNT